MTKIGGWIKGMAGLGMLAALTLLLVVLFNRAPRPELVGQATSPVETPAPTAATEAALQSPIQSPTPTWTPWPTPEPTPTWTPLPPPPTAIPTPVVTPIPTSAFPLIPEVEGVPKLPFWIYYWQGDQIGRIDSEGRDRELLLDTRERLGQWLTAYPFSPTEGDIGSRVVVSPDGKRLAIVVLDKIGVGMDEPFTYSIYLFDVQTDALTLLSPGICPTWSPDGQRIAFLSQNRTSMWIADLESGQIRERVAKLQDKVLNIPYLDWSPDGSQLAYVYSDGPYQLMPDMWVIDVDGDAPPRQVVRLDAPFFGVLWSPDGQQLIYHSEKGSKDLYQEVWDLWQVSVATGEKKPLTREMVVGSVQISPSRNWLLFSGFNLYEKEDSPYDLWLLSADGQDLRRVTVSDRGDLIPAYWSPDGTRLLVIPDEGPLFLLALDDGTRTVLDITGDTEVGIGGMR